MTLPNPLTSDLVDHLSWLWVKISHHQELDRICVACTKVPFWVPICDPQPLGRFLARPWCTCWLFTGIPNSAPKFHTWGRGSAVFWLQAVIGCFKAGAILEAVAEGLGSLFSRGKAVHLQGTSKISPTFIGMIGRGAFFTLVWGILRRFRLHQTPFTQRLAQTDCNLILSCTSKFPVTGKMECDGRWWLLV